MALDEEEKLQQFLAQKTFRYAVVANQANFIRKELGISGYPTHLVVDRNGVITKVTNRAEVLIQALKSSKSLKLE